MYCDIRAANTHLPSENDFSQSKSLNFFPASLAFWQLYNHLMILALRSMTDVPCRIFACKVSSRSPSLSPLLLVNPLSDVEMLTLRIFIASSSERAEKFSFPSDSMTSPESPQYLKKASKSAKFLEYLELISEWERLTPLPDLLSISGIPRRPVDFFPTLSLTKTLFFVLCSSLILPFSDWYPLAEELHSFTGPSSVAVFSFSIESCCWSVTSSRGTSFGPELISFLHLTRCFRSLPGPLSNSHFCL